MQITIVWNINEGNIDAAYNAPKNKVIEAYIKMMMKRDDLTMVDAKYEVRDLWMFKSITLRKLKK